MDSRSPSPPPPPTRETTHGETDGRASPRKAFVSKPKQIVDGFANRSFADGRLFSIGRTPGTPRNGGGHFDDRSRHHRRPDGTLKKDTATPTQP